MDSGGTRYEHGPISTARLDLAPPVDADLDGWFAVVSDPRLWEHFPSGRPTRREETAASLRRIADEWSRVGLGAWTVRRKGLPAVIGLGGCSLRRETFWNLGYRLAADTHGAGLATELAAEAVQRANRVRPDLPVLAVLLEHNLASAAVARKTGLTLQYRAPDAGNPDPAAVRLVFGDRPLTQAQLDAALHPVP